MNNYIFKTKTTMKPYNSRKWWIDENLICDKAISANTIADALAKYAESVKNDADVKISSHGLASRAPMYQDTKNGEPKQVGYVITGKSEFQDECGRWSTQFIELWITIITTVNTNFSEDKKGA